PRGNATHRALFHAPAPALPPHVIPSEAGRRFFFHHRSCDVLVLPPRGNATHRALFHAPAPALPPPVIPSEVGRRFFFHHRSCEDVGPRSEESLLFLVFFAARHFLPKKTLSSQA